MKTNRLGLKNGQEEEVICMYFKELQGKVIGVAEKYADLLGGHIRCRRSRHPCFPHGLWHKST